MNQEQTRLLATKVVQEYKIVLMDALQHSFPLLSKEELNDAINYSIKTDFIKANCSQLFKVFDETQFDEMIDYIENDDMGNLTVKDLK